jgi:hypothetical protein
MKISDGQELSRLLDEPGASTEGGVDPWAVGLLRAAAPYRSPVGRKQRVRVSLGHSTARRAPLFLRPVVVAGMLIGCGAFASAALGHWPGWMVRAYERLIPPPAGLATVPPPDARLHGHRSASTVAMQPSFDPPSLAPPSSDPPASSETTASPPRPRHAPSLTPVVEDTSDVLEAMRALRLERNPVRARVLLARYLGRHPTGTLAEEALAMSIEAAVAHHDADAAALGARYLRIYPAGPFHDLARQTQP